MLRIISALAVCLTIANTAGAARGNLLVGGDFEKTRDHDLPTGWSTYVPEGTAVIRTQSASPRTGRACVRLETPSDTKATLVSPPIPVAPGETLHLGVWCRTEDLATSSGGTLTFNAGFMDADRRYFRWQREQPAIAGTKDWFELSMETRVPSGAAYAVLQVGIARMTGRTWWDDAALTAERDFAVRFDLPGPTLEPGRQLVPLVVINRAHARSGQSVKLTAMPGGEKTEHKLSRESEQRVQAAFTPLRRGKVPLKLEARDEHGALLADATIEASVPPLLVTEPAVPTHWCVEDGEPRLESRVWIHEEPAARAELRLVCTLERTDGSAIATWRSAGPPADPVLCTLASAAPSIGDYTLRHVVERGGKKLAESTQPWHVIRRQDAIVTLSDRGHPVIAGRPVFPIGMFNGGRFAEQATAGFNVAHSYNAAATRPGQLPDNTRLKVFLDSVQAAGMKALVLVTHGSHARPIDDETVRRVRMFRNHPALLAWDEEEGIARGEAPLTLVRDMKAMLAREDPHHPFMVGDARDVIFKIKDRSKLFPAEHMDLGMWWWYPFPLSAVSAAELLEGEERSATAELEPPSFLTQAKTDKPIWVGLQAYKKPERKDARFPAPEEYRCQAHLAVIHGAKGLMYYVGSGSGGNGILNKPEEGRWDALKRVVTELRSIEDILLAPDAPESASLETSGAPISLRLRELGARRVLLAANRAAKSVRATIRLPEVPDGQASVRFEDRTVAVHRNRLSDQFDAFAVHVYHLPATTGGHIEQ